MNKPVFLKEYSEFRNATLEQIATLESSLANARSNLTQSPEFIDEATSWYSANKDSSDFDVILGPESEEEPYQDIITQAIKNKGRLYFAGTVGSQSNLSRVLTDYIKDAGLDVKDVKIIDLALDGYVSVDNNSEINYSGCDNKPNFYANKKFKEDGLLPVNVKSIDDTGDFDYSTDGEIDKSYRAGLLEGISSLVKMVGICNQDEWRMSYNMDLFARDLLKDVPIVESYEHSAKPSSVRLYGTNIHLNQDD